MHDSLVAVVLCPAVTTVLTGCGSSSVQPDTGKTRVTRHVVSDKLRKHVKEARHGGDRLPTRLTVLTTPIIDCALSLVPDLEEAVPRSRRDGHPVLRHAEAAHAVVVAGQDTYKPKGTCHDLQSLRLQMYNIHPTIL